VRDRLILVHLTLAGVLHNQDGQLVLHDDLLPVHVWHAHNGHAIWACEQRRIHKRRSKL
jgi:hypothetical protein